MVSKIGSSGDQGIPQALIDEAELDSVVFVVKSGQEAAVKQALRDAKGLNRLAYEKAIEWDKRVQLALAEGKNKNEAMEFAFSEVFEDMSAAKLVTPVKGFLKQYSDRFGQDAESFFDSKSTAIRDITPGVRVVDNIEHRGSQWDF